MHLKIITLLNIGLLTMPNSFAQKKQKKNLLAWFGFEETAFMIGAELEMI